MTNLEPHSSPTSDDPDSPELRILLGYSGDGLTEPQDGSEWEVDWLQASTPVLWLGAELVGFEDVVRISATLARLDGSVQADGEWHIRTVGTDDSGVRRIWGMRLWLLEAEPCFEESCTLWIDGEDDHGSRADASANVLLRDGRTTEAAGSGVPAALVPWAS